MRFVSDITLLPRHTFNHGLPALWLSAMPMTPVNGAVHEYQTDPSAGYHVRANSSGSMVAPKLSPVIVAGKFVITVALAKLSLVGAANDCQLPRRDSANIARRHRSLDKRIEWSAGSCGREHQNFCDRSSRNRTESQPDFGDARPMKERLRYSRRHEEPK